ncbi:hypothetical protein X798_02475 [Onchocerca flexuosa]|uniref:Uncharacterized protein n=1 Tax=Onchocerca flexuosa TaxID=387005 RepID=A0A238BYU8_9BILA|nr:hypothetical protein X798_02475 [Onchocerca flexuosa]
MDRAVKKTTDGAQDFSVYRKTDNYVTNKKIPTLPDNPIHRNYCSLKQLQHTVDEVDEIALTLYRWILNEVNADKGTDHEEHIEHEHLLPADCFAQTRLTLRFMFLALRMFFHVAMGVSPIRRVSTWKIKSLHRHYWECSIKDYPVENTFISLLKQQSFHHK